MTLLFTRSTSATDLLPSAAAGAAFNTYAVNGIRIVAGEGVLMEERRDQYVAAPTAPATQTVSLAVGSYTMWVNGSGSATIAAGTAVGTNFGAVTTGTPRTITITTAGTVTITVTGSLQAMQLENGPFATSFISGSSRETESLHSDVVVAAASAYTLYAAFKPLCPLVVPNNQYIFSLGDGTTTHHVSVVRNLTDGFIHGAYVIAAAGGTAVSGVPIGPGVFGSVIFACAANDQAVQCNTGAIETAAGVPAPTAVPTVRIGARTDGGLPFSGFIRRVALVRSRVPNGSFVLLPE